ncbi:unnamed protein product [Sympodiomycopsis kandeliae]
MDDEALRAMLPMGFGKQKASSAPKNVIPTPPAPAPAPQASTSASSTSKRPPQDQDQDQDQDEEEEEDDDGLTAADREANKKAAAATSDSEDDDDDDDDSDDEPGPSPPKSLLPIDSHVELGEHAKSVSALSIDSSGARIATGSYDYDVRLWDFGGMTSSFKPFKNISESFGSYWIHDLSWSDNGEHLLAVSGTSQAKLFDRNGNLLTTFKKGDVYLRDMKQTSGHVSEITSCSWKSRQEFITTSADSTIRLWDPENPLKQNTVINVKSKERGTRTKVTSHALSSDHRMLAAGCQDGCLHLWSTSGTYSSPNSSIQSAHIKGNDVSSVQFSRDAKYLISRGTEADDTVKLWDVRQFKKPVAEQSGLHTGYAQTSVIYSPDEEQVLTGTSDGTIEVLSSRDLSHIQTVSLPSSSPKKPSVIRLAWHSRINQLFATTSTGSTLIYYSPTRSIRGALLCTNKHSTKSRHSIEDAEIGPIITPEAMTRGQGISQASKKRKLAKQRQDPIASQIPSRPLHGAGRGGRIGVAYNTHLSKNFEPNELESRKQDPREALLKYADQKPKFTAAWHRDDNKK